MYTSARARPICASSFSSSLPAWPTNGSALLVLVEARRLADEHQVRVRVARAEHDLRAALREAAARAPCDGFRIGLQLVDVLGRYGAHGREDYAYLRMETNPGPPGAARRLDLDLVALRLAEHCLPDRRFGRHAADARDLDRHLLAVLALELDRRADRDDAARGRGRLVDHLRRCGAVSAKS